MNPRNYEPGGVIPAALMPFDRALEIDESAYRRHLHELAETDGVDAITINGHASEVHALSVAEQRRSLEIAVDEVGGSVPLIAGIATTRTREAAELAKIAESVGASALLVFPNEALVLGGQRRPECARAHVGAIAEACGLPIVLFQYPFSSGLGYPLETLLDLCREVPSIRAIKDWCNDPHLHERQLRELHALERPVKVLTTHSMWLLPSLLMGCDGLLSGAGSVIAPLQVALWRAVRAGELATAREVNDRIYETTLAFYADPLLDMHNRMKAALVLLARLEESHVRPPLCRLPEPEIERIRGHLVAAGLLR
jgi:4-hydroxy-tetrahydrodipicolinate synthase